MFKSPLNRRSQSTQRAPGSTAAGSRSRPASGRRQFISPSTRRSLIAAAVIAVIGIVIFGTSTFWINWWWFGSVGYRSVLVTRYLAQFGMFIAFGLVAGGFFLANAVFALRRTRAALAAASGRPASGLIDRILLPLIIAGAAVVFVIAGSTGWSNWNAVLLFVNAGDFGVSDPVYDRDAGFYIFALPILQLLRSSLTLLVFVTAVSVALVYAIRLGVDPRNIRRIPRLMRTHVLALVGGLLLLLGGSFWLANYELVYSDRGVVFGASYTDVNVQRWANWIMVVLSAGIAGLLVMNAFVQRVRWLVAAMAAWAVLAVVLVIFIPAAVQQAVVNPSEFQRESAYIGNNIEMTRAAYGLDDVTTRELPGVTAPTAAEIAANPDTIDNIRLWDYRVIQETYQRNNALAPYYVFTDVDVARYQIDGEVQQVLMSARELDINGLPENAQTWTNTHLTYTHGYGVVASPVNGVSQGGQPAYLVSGIPPEGTGPLTIDRPQIYFGESTDGWVILNSNEAEFDGLIGGSDAAVVPYAGEAAGSIDLGNSVSRLISAVYLRDRNVFLSGSISGESRLVLRRDIVERVETIAPFFSYDADPYLVVADGQLYWILDGYTSTDRFPNATRVDGVNYLRNSVKVVVDAYDGTISFYRTGTADPIADAYAEIYGDLFTPISEAPPAIAVHFRYPERLFNIQAEAMAAYHVTDPKLYYDGEERWAIAQEQVRGEVQQMEPYYVTLTLPEEQVADFTLMLPFTPGGRATGQNNQNMTAWMAARTDGEGGPRLVIYRFPRQVSIDGPRQVEARIDQDPEISSQLTLWSQSGSEVIRGNLLVIPLETGNLYVQPLYLRAAESEAGFPEVQRVIVATTDRVVMRPTFAEALAAVVDPAASTAGAIEGAPSNDVTDVSDVADQVVATVEAVPSPVGTQEAGVDGDLASQALAAFQRAQDAQERGDWSVYGQELATLQGILENMAGDAGAAPIATPST